MGKKVIVVDDSRTARVQVRNALDGAGYDVVEAVDGSDGLAKVAQNVDASLIICDVNMPTMNGLEMIAQLQNDGVRVPVVMLTTEAQPELLKQAMRSGAKGWIVKPFKPPMLLAAVRKLVGDA